MSTYAYLGPAATFTEAALKKITGPNDQLIPYANVTAALNAVRKNEAKFALVPIENSIEGVVARTLDELATGDPLVIAGEVTLPVSFAFMVKPGTKEIKRIATHPHAEAQCRTYVATNYPHAEVVATNNSIKIMQFLDSQPQDVAAKLRYDGIDKDEIKKDDDTTDTTDTTDDDTLPPGTFNPFKVPEVFEKT